MPSEMTFLGENTVRGVTEQEVTSRLHPLEPPCLGHVTHFSELRGLTRYIFQNFLSSLLHCGVGKRPWKTFEDRTGDSGACPTQNPVILK